MIGVLLLTLIVSFAILAWMLKRKHDETYTEILITYPFDSLRKGEVIVFKSGLEVEVGDYVLIHLPGYETIWKVTKREGEKLELVNRRKEVLIGFPLCHIWGKMVGQKGEELC